MTSMLIRVGHSPDSDDAFMFYALARHKIDTGRYDIRHEMQDIASLNQRALKGELEVTAISLHAFPYVSDKYALMSCGASIGDGYGPMVVSKRGGALNEYKGKRIAIPGELTTANLALRLCLPEFEAVSVPFDQILETVSAGTVDAGLIIHEGQLTYRESGLQLVVDLGAWWKEKTDLPLPLGANAVRRDLGKDVMRDVTKILKQSIVYGLEHRKEALDYAMEFGRGLDRAKGDQFVGMYVNDYTIDFGETGRKAVERLLNDGYKAGIITAKPALEFISA